MKRIKLAILLMLLCTLFISIAQLLYKSGADKLEFSFLSIISKWNIFLGLFLYGLGAILLIAALRYGKLSVLYPIIASSYIWVALGSMYFFGESISLFRWLGVILIVGGIIIINLSGKGAVEFTEAV